MTNEAMDVYELCYNQRIDSGVITYVYSDQFLLRSVTPLQGKVSVNTGSFIPGVYRVNPYSVWNEETDSEKDKFFYTFQWSWNSLKVCQHTGNPIQAMLANHRMDPPSELENYADRALQKAYGKIQRADIGLGENLGELRETIQMLRRPLSSLREFLSWRNYSRLKSIAALKAYSKTGRWRKTKLNGGLSAADTWLEIRYGLRPLVYSVIDVMKLVQEVAEKNFNPATIRSVKASVSGRSNDRFNIEEPTGYMAYLLDVQVENKCAAYASVQYRQSMPTPMQTSLGLSAESLPELAWELTRLSFVVDWLFTIGPWLSSYRIKPNVEILGNTVGKRLQRVYVCTSSSYRMQTTDAPWVPNGPTGRKVFNSYDREVDRDLPLLPLFTAGDIIDLFRAIDGAALILQPLLKKLRRM